MLATDPLPPGRLLTLSSAALSVQVAPEAGGRIAQIACDGVPQLVGHGEHGATAAIAWGSYPMVPWAGRTRRGRFDFRGRSHRLPPNLGEHAIHGVGFVMPWEVVAHSATHVELALALPADARWPFGGIARQHIEVDGRQLRQRLSLTAGAQAMPATFGWHPWFRKPDRLEFSPAAIYPRDAEGIAVAPPVPPTPGPWDDCFLNQAPVVLHRGDQRLRLTSDCRHWVVYDQTAHATCVEPQRGPADGLNLEPVELEPGATAEAWFLMAWD